jgi:predicted ester cyclase
MLGSSSARPSIRVRPLQEQSGISAGKGNAAYKRDWSNGAIFPHRTQWSRSRSQEPTLSTITETAREFFEACESGKGWDACKVYCTSTATFDAQAEPLADTKTLQAYAEWMKGLLTFIPDGRYVLKSFATDHARKSVSAFALFSGTHTGEGGPLPPTGKSTNTDYVYVMEFEGDKIRHMTKIWNSGWALKELGWA